MNSDRIRARFGSYGITVLAQDSRIRVANLYSEHEPRPICRTLAVTVFETPLAQELALPHQQILEGGSIGATLRASEWRVIKSDARVFTADSGPHFEALTAGSVPEGTDIAIQVYSLHAARENSRFPYAAIAEAYHPEHVTPLGAPSAEATPEILGGGQQSAIRRLLSSLHSAEDADSERPSPGAEPMRDQIPNPGPVR